MLTKHKERTFNKIILDSCISSGTLRTADLLNAFADELERLTPLNGAQLIAEARQNAQILNGIDKGILAPTGYDESVAQDVLNDLFNNLDNLAPDGYYFGAHEVDYAHSVISKARGVA